MQLPLVCLHTVITTHVYHYRLSLYKVILFLKITQCCLTCLVIRFHGFKIKFSFFPLTCTTLSKTLPISIIEGTTNSNWDKLYNTHQAKVRKIS